MVGAEGAAKSTAKEMMEFSEKNPLLSWGVGGLAGAGAIWLFGKIDMFLKTKMPRLAGNKFFRPIAKTVTSIVLYAVSKLDFVKKIPFAHSAIFGAGVSLFGSMIAEAALSKIGTMNNKPAAPAGNVTMGAGNRTAKIFGY